MQWLRLAEMLKRNQTIKGCFIFTPHFLPKIIKVGLDDKREDYNNCSVHYYWPA